MIKTTVARSAIALKGYELLNNNRLNKGTAFSAEERLKFELEGKLPPKIETLEEQIERAKFRFDSTPLPINKNLFLNSVYQENATLFFALVSRYLEEMMPIIYTPTVGEAVKYYSENYQKSCGIVISYQDIDRIDEILAQAAKPDLEVAIVTDGEGVLGIGDQGVGGLNIAIGKLMVYTLCGGINPFKTLPIQLDLGTNNEKLLNNPNYLGWKHSRIVGEEYYEFMDKFVAAFKKRFPNALLHWEDFGRDKARSVLNRYRETHQSFNDDIQGTASVALAAVLSAIKKTNTPIEEHKFCIFGAGTAGAGIADQICQALAYMENKSEEEIRQRFFLIDKCGLLQESHENLLNFQKPYAKTANDLNDWNIEKPDNISLLEVMQNAKPTILIGCSTLAGAFDNRVIATMYSYCRRPIIMPLSNPTSKAEREPKDLIKLTDGNALIATGSPFGPVSHDGQTYPIAQCNNALGFPGIGIGMIISKAKVLTDKMIYAASVALADSCPKDSTQLLPDLTNILQISQNIGIAVAKQAIEDGVAQNTDPESLPGLAKELIWTPEYKSYL
jgi:malate dehydrogenase (oxaloacetate-decarboxylating)